MCTVAYESTRTSSLGMLRGGCGAWCGVNPTLAFFFLSLSLSVLHIRNTQAVAFAILHRKLPLLVI